MINSAVQASTIDTGNPKQFFVSPDIFGVGIKLGQVRQVFTTLLEHLEIFNQKNIAHLHRNLGEEPSRSSKRTDHHEHKIAYWIKETYTGLSLPFIQKLFVMTKDFTNWKALVWPATLHYLGTIDIAKQLPLADVVINGCKKIDSDPLIHLGKMIAADEYSGGWLLQRLANVMSRGTHNMSIADLVSLVEGLSIMNKFEALEKLATFELELYKLKDEIKANGLMIAPDIDQEAVQQYVDEETKNKPEVVEVMNEMKGFINDIIIPRVNDGSFLIAPYQIYIAATLAL